ncbi:MAG: PadR family transcriptional regulator [Aquificota bacterium]|nr:MAG: PadR family transcriptional regulator [Aquificota bacterium]
MTHSVKILTKRNLWPFVLSVLKSEGKVYAYELDSIIDRMFGFKPNKIMLYLVLYSLEDGGLARSKFVERRKYYTITRKGEEELKRFKTLLKVISNQL